MTAGLVAFGPNEWHGPWMNRQQLLSRIGRVFPTIYTTGYWTVWKTAEPEWKEAPWFGNMEHTDDVCVDTAPRWMIDWPRISPWSHYCLNAHTRRLLRQASRLGIKPLIGYAFHPRFAAEIRALDPGYVVYHEYDLLTRTPGWNAASDLKREYLIERAHLIVASSQTIADDLVRVGATDVLLLPNGADVEAFMSAADTTASEPEGLRDIPHPRIGYIGNINRKVDLGLASYLAARHPEWQFVFVGSVGNLDDTTRQALSECCSRRNVHFLGGKDHRALPSYVAAMDVNTLLYRTDDSVWTAGIYPLKLHEYLAAGLPVVSAPIPSIREFGRVVAIASDREDWEDLIRAALAGQAVGTRDSRRAVARENSWDIRAERLAEALQSLTQ